MMKRFKLKLFSLIELIIVLAVIAILASLLTPALNKTIKMVREKGCLKNLQQMAIALQLYAEDYDATLPIGEVHVWHWRWAKDRTPFERAMLPYLYSDLSEADLKNPSDVLFVCPSSPVEWRDGHYYHDGTKSTQNTYEGLYYSYGLSTANANDFVLKSDLPLKLNTYSKPYGTPFQFCSRRLSPAWILDGTNNRLAAASWHEIGDFGARPTMFLDGHASALESPIYSKGGDQSILKGSYSTYQLATGTGSPPHEKYDFWVR